MRLFDLSQDAREKYDVALKHAEITQQLTEQLEHLIASGRSRPAN